MVTDRCESLQSASSCGRCERRQPSDGEDKRGLNTKVHLAVEARGLPVRVLVTSGTSADCSPALALIEGFAAKYLLIK